MPYTIDVPKSFKVRAWIDGAESKSVVKIVPT